MPEPVVVVEYDPEWPLVFKRLRSRLAESLGALPVSIEHVGSTSIPGAAAKPIIDVDVVIPSVDDLGRTIELLAKAGYRHAGDLGIPGREAFESPAGLPAHHLYVVARGSSELSRHVLFRDYLRAHPEAVERYSALKRRLAARHRDDREAYTEGKTAFVEEILRRARSP